MTITLKHLIIGLILLVNVSAFAQKQDPKDESAKKEKKKKKKKKEIIPENIEVFPKNFYIRPRYVYPEISVNTSNRLFGKGEKFKYKSAVAGLVGLSVKIKKVYISVAVQLPAGESIKKQYGTTKFTDINVNIQGRAFLWGLYYRDYKGFYLKNHTSYYPDWNIDSIGYPLSRGLRIVETGINFGYIFNDDFSMDAAFNQGERQKTSAGSLLAGFSERYQRIEADTSFVPPTQGELYPNLDKFKYGDFVSSIAYIGFGYQLVYKKFHFTPVGMVGSGIQFQNYRQIDEKRFWINFATYAILKAQLGYNGDRFFANLIYIKEFNTIPIKESKIRMFHNWIEFGMGLRF